MCLSPTGTHTMILWHNDLCSLQWTDLSHRSSSNLWVEPILLTAWTTLFPCISNASSFSWSVLWWWHRWSIIRLRWCWVHLSTRSQQHVVWSSTVSERQYVHSSLHFTRHETYICSSKAPYPRSEVLIVVKIHTMHFWVITACSKTRGYQNFRENLSSLLWKSQVDIMIPYVYSMFP